MKAIIYVGHGSSVEERNEQFIQFTNQIIKQVRCLIQEPAFLELATPTITNAIDTCVEKGATEITVVPILLLPGIHVSEDIPLEISKGKKQHPELIINYAKPLGSDGVIVEMIRNRVVERDVFKELKKAVLLVSHGSRNQQAVEEFEQLAIACKNEISNQYDVYTAYLKMTVPSLEEQLDNLKIYNYQEIYVVPHFLFSGGFEKEIEEVTQSYQKQMPNTSIIHCEPTGFDHTLIPLIVKRINQT
ncbi:sirohydrochlorin chelatase [Aquibacillus rhizosphaerae]|uniref:Sirohydrochlorin chelatase n=1 Tax=Aquibacillus rhizosphaerae TaxID=3051431 RepID=A0ABT7LCQ1_9BACI|nr:sirohydrochlorin chelatase [Aquibacillus sp. LR5S19]MDL4843037.1 sirohydrochlorin chelatase [Aquibacillus sp. LR5S19]